MSLADEPNVGAVHGAIATALEAEDEARMKQLDRLIAKGFGSTDPKHIPKEEIMPKGIRTKPHECCGSMGSRHLATCTRKAPKLPPAPKRSRPARGVRIELRVEDVDELLERRDALLQELEHVDDRIRKCLAAKEEELAKLRAAVEAATKRAQAAQASAA